VESLVVAEFEIANVIGWIEYRQELDLAQLAETFEQRDEINYVSYEPAENHWLKTRFAPDDTYVPFYRSGKASITGSNSPEHFRKIAERVNELMRELLDFDYEPNTEIKNIVAVAEIDSSRPLESIAIGLGLEDTEYEPEQFPAVIYRSENAVFLIFASGKIVCTGIAEVEQISSAIDKITKKIDTMTV
jgi:transcription initiation factor TFIID TATA-box-binding protein